MSPNKRPQADYQGLGVSWLNANKRGGQGAWSAIVEHKILPAARSPTSSLATSCRVANATSRNGHTASSPRGGSLRCHRHHHHSGRRYAHTSVFVQHFPNEEALRAWEESEERNRLVQEAGEFSTPNVQRATGLETWFVLPGERAIVPPPRWKMLLITLMGAYPLVVLYSAFVLPSLEGWPLLVRAAVLPIVLLSLMTYVIMPQLSRLLGGWLYPHQTRTATT